MYTFFNSGNYCFFKPYEKIFQPTSKIPMIALDFYIDLVKFMNRPDVFILDEAGKTISI